MVPAPRLELGRPFGQGILSPLRLPIPPSGHDLHPNLTPGMRQPSSGLGHILDNGEADTTSMQIH